MPGIKERLLPGIKTKNRHPQNLLPSSLSKAGLIDRSRPGSR